MEVSLSSLKHHHQFRYCFKCFKKFQLPLLDSILFKDVQICPSCTEKIQAQKKIVVQDQKVLKINDIYAILKTKPDDRLQIFLPHSFKCTTSFCVAGYEGSLLITELQKFLSVCSKIRLHNVKDMSKHISYLRNSCFPKFNITFSNITRLQLKGQNIDNLEFVQYFDFRNLEDLSVWDNNIVQLRGLNKCRFPKLSQIHLSHNRIIDVSSLSRADFSKLEKTSLGFRQSPSFQEYKSLLKIASKDLKTVYLNYLPFIQFYDKSLHHKYNNIHIVSLNNCQYSTGRRNL